MNQFVISGFHIRGPEKCNIKHNQRDIACVVKEEHIYTLEKLKQAKDPREAFWVPEYKCYIPKQFDDGSGHLKPMEECYEIIFGEAIKEYNATQVKNPSRKIENGAVYYKKINEAYKKTCNKKGVQKKNPAPYYEIILGFYSHYGTDPDVLLTRNQIINREWVMPATQQKELLGKYLNSFQKRNPNVIILAAYYHDDENGQIHIHLVVIFVGEKEKGLSKIVSQTKAIELSGKAQGKDFSLIPKTERTKTQFPKERWIASEVEVLDGMCREHGYEVMHPVQQGRAKKKKDLDKSEYIMKAETEENIRVAQQLQQKNEDMKRQLAFRDTEIKKYQVELEKIKKEKDLLETEVTHLKDEEDFLKEKLVSLKGQLDGFLLKCGNTISYVEKKILSLEKVKKFAEKITTKALTHFEEATNGMVGKNAIEREKKRGLKTITESMFYYLETDEDEIKDVSRELVLFKTDLFETAQDIQNAMDLLPSKVPDSSDDYVDDKDLNENEKF